ncbi:MAG: hypothetical protein AAF587_39170 [Bacteroidota bacterium]
MTDSTPHSGLSVQYFCPPDLSFWKWAEGGTVIEWKDGKTLCYREDLTNLLNGLRTTGYLPLGTILLLIEACKGSRTTLGHRLKHLYQILEVLQEEDPAPVSPETLQHHMDQAIQFLGQVSDLPSIHKRGRSRIQLLAALGELCKQTLAPTVATYLYDEFEQGAYDEQIFDHFQETDSRGIHHFLAPLHTLQNIFVQPNSLASFLQTGVIDVPEPKEIPLIEEEKADLLADLLDDPKTYGMAKLAQRLLASLHLPRPLQSSNQQSFGGVSDLSNRGELDHLILSELANDEDILMARLVNNEVLYYHHEEPPASMIQHRVILIDTTIKMWGIPRLYAISAALSLVMFNKKDFPTDVLGVGGNEFFQLDLQSKEGVLSALTLLDPALHCRKSLLNMLSPLTLPFELHPDKTEFVLISGEQMEAGIQHSAEAAELKRLLDFQMVVDREGQVDVYRFAHGHYKQISQAKINLSETLFAHPRVSRSSTRKKTSSKQKPIFYSQHPHPLFLPTVSIRLKGNRVVEVDTPGQTRGYVGITTTHRLLYWPSSDTGAIEIADDIPEGYLFWGFYEKETLDSRSSHPHIGLLVYEHSSGKFHGYDFHITAQTTTSVALDLQLEPQQINGLTFLQDFGCFNIHLMNGEIREIFSGDSAVHSLAPAKEHNQQVVEANLFPLANSRNRYRPKVSTIKAFINNGYSALLQAKRVEIRQDGRLFIREFELRYQSVDRGIWLSNPGGDAASTNLVPCSRPNMWSDGSTAILDKRGLLHLRSSDPSLPEMTIILVIGVPTACWAASGIVCGNPYFTGLSPKKRIDNHSFFDQYLQRFIQVILTHENPSNL